MLPPTTLVKRRSFAVDSSFTTKLLPMGPYVDTRIHIATMKREKELKVASLHSAKLELLKQKFLLETKMIRRLQNSILRKQKEHAAHAMIICSATVIQAAFRGMKGRRAMILRRRERTGMLIKQRLHFLRYLQYRKRIARVIEGALIRHRGRYFARKSLRMAKAAVQLQRLVRGFFARKLARKKRVARFVAVTYSNAVVQYVTRCIQKYYSWLICCATKIQKLWRLKRYRRAWKVKRENGRGRRRKVIRKEAARATAPRKTGQGTVQNTERPSTPNVEPVEETVDAGARSGMRSRPPNRPGTGSPKQHRQRVKDGQASRQTKPTEKANNPESVTEISSFNSLSVMHHLNLWVGLPRPHPPKDLPSSEKRPTVALLVDSKDFNGSLAFP